jgi:hypothetical protein
MTIRDLMFLSRRSTESKQDYNQRRQISNMIRDTETVEFTHWILSITIWF